MTDNIELRSKYSRLIEAIQHTLPPVDIDDGPKRGPQPEPWKLNHRSMSFAVAAEMMSAIRLKVVADKAGNSAALNRAEDRISAIARGWCGNDPIIIVIPPVPWPDPDPQPEWLKDPMRRREDLVSNMMAEIDRLQPGAVAEVATEIAVQLLKT